jgi:hypothetical protein
LRSHRLPPLGGMVRRQAVPSSTPERSVVTSLRSRGKPSPSTT